MESHDQEQDVEDTVSEQSYVQTGEEESQPEVQPKMVPLAALEAERRKRQESEAKAQMYQDHLMRSKESQPKEPEEDPGSLVELQKLREVSADNKRDILETLWKDLNPQSVQKVNTHLKAILEKKPWLAESVDSAQNRWARAYEVVEDYMHLIEPKTMVNTKIQDAQRMVQNANKPRSPAESGKSAQPKGMEYLKSIQGTKEFREYRQKVRQG